MLKKAEKKTSRVIADLDAADVFGIDMDGKAGSIKTSASKKRKAKIVSSKSQTSGRKRKK